MHLQGSALQDAAGGGFNGSINISNNFQIEPLMEQIETKIKDKLKSKSNKADFEMLMKQLGIMSRQIKEIVQLMMQKFKLSLEA